MKTAGNAAARGWVTCETCGAKLRDIEAIVREEGETVARFCSLACCERWERGFENRAAPAAEEGRAPESGIQLGRGRGPAREERVKRLIRQHPQRDEPLIDSVERDEVP
jgi:hypothetical protein